MPVGKAVGKEEDRRPATVRSRVVSPLGYVSTCFGPFCSFYLPVIMSDTAIVGGRIACLANR